MSFQSIFAWKTFRVVLATLHHASVWTLSAVTAHLVALDIFWVLESFTALWAGALLAVIRITRRVVND